MVSRWPFLSLTIFVSDQKGDINHFGQWPIFTDHWSLTNEQKGDLNTVKQLAGGASSGYKMIGERWRLFWFVWEKARHVNNSDQLPERALVGGRHWKTLVGGRHWWVEDSLASDINKKLSVWVAGCCCTCCDVFWGWMTNNSCQNSKVIWTLIRFREHVSVYSSSPTSFMVGEPDY